MTDIKLSIEADRIVREREVARLTQLSRSTRWRLSRQGRFPKSLALSPGARGWRLSEITEWLRTRTAVSADPAPLRSTCEAGQ